MGILQLWARIKGVIFSRVGLGTRATLGLIPWEESKAEGDAEDDPRAGVGGRDRGCPRQEHHPT